MTFFVVSVLFSLSRIIFTKRSARPYYGNGQLCALLQFVFVVSPTRDFNTRIYDLDYILILILSQAEREHNF